MALVRVEKNVPEVYVDTSRDFQLISRVYTATLNALLFDISSMKYVSDTSKSSESLLDLLCTRLGFFESDDIDREALRSVLSCFPVLVKNKGSLKCLYKAVTMFLKIKHIKTSFMIQVVNKELGPDDTIVDTYKIFISTEKDVGNTDVLDALWKYLIPTGYNVEYVRISVADIEKFKSIYHDSVVYADTTLTTNTTLGEIRSPSDTYIGDTIEDRTIGGVDTFVIFSPGDED